MKRQYTTKEKKLVERRMWNAFADAKHNGGRKLTATQREAFEILNEELRAVCAVLFDEEINVPGHPLD